MVKVRDEGHEDVLTNFYTALHKGEIMAGAVDYCSNFCNNIVNASQVLKIIMRSSLKCVFA